MLRKINVFMIYVPSYGGCCPVPFSVIHALIKIDLFAGDSLQTPTTIATEKRRQKYI